MMNSRFGLGTIRRPTCRRSSSTPAGATPRRSARCTSNRLSGHHTRTAISTSRPRNGPSTTPRWPIGRPGGEIEQHAEGEPMPLTWDRFDEDEWIDLLDPDGNGDDYGAVHFSFAKG